jgi:ABC-type glycerol-3-phosphate transport system permease component
MLDRPRKFWQSGTLHAVLIGGSLVFALPYFWLVGTSWKLDKEVQSEEITILPQRPNPRPVSPYIDELHFSPVTRPEEVDRARWDGWIAERLTRTIEKSRDAWLLKADPRVAGLDSDTLNQALVSGAFHRLRRLLPLDSWNNDSEEVFLRRVEEKLDAALFTELFEQCYRYFAIGKVLIKDRNYRITDLTEGAKVEEIWHVDRGPARLTSRIESDRPVAVVEYDFQKGEDFAVSSMLDLPIDPSDLKRIALSFRRDQTWHELRLIVEVAGRRLESASPRYLGEDTWWEINFQEPSPDDARLTARRYVLLKETGRGEEFNHGPRKMKLTVRVERSSTPEAYWAKGTENYRKAFEEVPFWRYFKTSVFLVIANIVGTALSCSLAAFAFARLSWPGRNLCFVLVLATMMIPPQVTMIPSFVIYKYLGWYNTLAPLWAPNWLAVNAFAVFLLRQAMKGIPRDLEEAAQIDGCGWFRIYWTIALPLMRPAIAAISIFTFMFVWNDFMTPLIYVNDQRLYPLALGLFSFLAGRENQFTLIMAGSMIMTMPVILIFFLAQRHFIQGVTMTGMKN